MQYTQLDQSEHNFSDCEKDTMNTSLGKGSMSTSYGKGEAAACDPFYKVRDNVNTQVERIKVKHDKFQDLLRNCDTAVNVDFKDLRKALLKELKAAEKDVRGLQVAIEMIEKNR